MKIIKVKYTDANLNDYEFKMMVPKNETKLNIDHIVMNEIFDHVVADYSWNEVGE